MTLDDADDTAIGRLRTPLSSESVLAEPQLQRALAAAMAMPIPTTNARGGLDLEGVPASDMPETLGEYQLLEELGHGGMGRVYKALHTKLDRIVAVKVLSRGRVGDRQAINRFEREMKAVGRLAHPNIVQAYDAREINDMPVLIMEFVDGLDLAETVRRVGRLPVADACELVRRTALALQCAHEHGLVHRDIKPSNIMLARSGEVKLLDLGLARFYAEDGAGVPPVPADVPPLPAGDEMTGTGQAMGTADYMAPEQASDSRTVDIRADLYSLGCTLYKLLSGQAPSAAPSTAPRPTSWTPTSISRSRRYNSLPPTCPRS
jgi:serine/threonine protein kinase